MINAKDIAKDFPILQQKINNHDLVYLDNGATTQKPVAVINAIQKYYQTSNANVHRSVHELASRATISYENARSVVAKFINARTEEIIFTSGTTDSLNKLSRSLKSLLKPGDEILLTEMEHHSNIVPWQQIAKETNTTIKYLPITNNYRLDLVQLSSLITSKTKIFALTHISNVLGTINPIKEIIQSAKAINKDIISVIDAAQSVPHIKVDVVDLDCDFLAFSSHKVLGPMGIGVLFGKAKMLKQITPNNFGGGMILSVTKDESSWNEIPYKFEAGTPNIAGVAGLAAALSYLNKLGMQNIEVQMQELTTYGLTELSKIPGVQIIGPQTANNRAPVFSFTIGGIHPHDISEILNSKGIAIRGGHHCAMPLFNTLKINGASRASAYIYNSNSDIDALVSGIKEAQKIFKVNQ